MGQLIYIAINIKVNHYNVVANRNLNYNTHGKYQASESDFKYYLKCRIDTILVTVFSLMISMLLSLEVNS